MAITISIIVPVYNVKDYLLTCLNSIAAQTFTDWECIIVDDGSTDGSGELCDQFAATDPRFQVIHQQNMGLPGARNSGLDVAQGEYIGFVDSDDYIHPEMYQVLLDGILKNGADLSIVFARHVTSLDEEFLPNPPIEYRLMNREQTFHYWFVETSSWMELVWNKLYRRDFLSRYGLLFPPVKTIAEDYLFS